MKQSAKRVENIWLIHYHAFLRIFFNVHNLNCRSIVFTRKIAFPFILVCHFSVVSIVAFVVCWRTNCSSFRFFGFRLCRRWRKINLTNFSRYHFHAQTHRGNTKSHLRFSFSHSYARTAPCARNATNLIWRELHKFHFFGFEKKNDETRT